MAHSRSGIEAVVAGLAVLVVIGALGLPNAISSDSSSTSKATADESREFAQMLTARDWKDRNIRDAVLEAAMVCGSKEMGPIFAKALVDADPKIRLTAIGYLQKYEWVSEIHLDILAKIVQSKEPSGRSTALRILGKQEDERAVRAVLKALEHPESDMRGTALDCMQGWHVQKLTDAQVSRLCDDRDRDIRLNVLRLLGRSRTKGWEAHALRALDDQDAEVRLMAVRLCGGVAVPGLKVERLKPLLEDANPEIRSAAVVAVPSCDDGGVGILMPFLKDSSPRVRQALAAACWQLPPKDAEALFRKLLDDPDRDVRLMVLRRVHKPGDNQVSLLVHACSDSDESVAIMALELLLTRDRAAASDAASSLFGRATGSTVKQRIVAFTRQLNTGKATEVLWAALHDKADGVRKSAISALPHCKPEVLNALEAMGREKDKAVETLVQECAKSKEGRATTQSTAVHRRATSQPAQPLKQE